MFLSFALLEVLPSKHPKCLKHLKQLRILQGQFSFPFQQWFAVLDPILFIPAPPGSCLAPLPLLHQLCLTASGVSEHPGTGVAPAGLTFELEGTSGLDWQL